MPGTLSHVAFIMDGNRRWARKHVLSLFQGHNSGAENIEKIVEFAKKRQISYVTFWAFSTENWNRKQEEVAALLDVMRIQMRSPMIERLKSNNVRCLIIGDLSRFPQDIVDAVDRLVRDTKNNTGITATIALNYGGREEILSAVRKVARLHTGSLTEEQFANQLYTGGMPDPDLIIRTGGEQRLSGFLPWQSVYAELYFTKTLWPDFNEKKFAQALLEYAKRQRRYGT
jgi:undecaprenyl diphosphate synthase